MKKPFLQRFNLLALYLHFEGLKEEKSLNSTMNVELMKRKKKGTIKGAVCLVCNSSEGCQSFTALQDGL